MAQLSVDKVFQFVQFVSNKESRGWISPEEFNLAAELAQLEAYSKREAAYIASKQILNDIRPFIKKSGTLSPTAGIITYPTDLRHFVSARYVAGNVGIKEFTQGEWDGILDSTIVPMTAGYPGCIQRENGLEVSPATVDATIEYIAAPTAPEWAYTVVSSRPVYASGSSTDFGFDEFMFMEIAANVLMHVGLNIDKDSVAQYGAAFNQKG
jgi:hypothetical protein